MLDQTLRERRAVHDVCAANEEPLQFGEAGRMFGILTLPQRGAAGAKSAPVFLFLNAGVLHRVGPLRMYVRLARELARHGFASFRVDLSGVGDSPPRAGSSYRDSVTADFTAIEQALEARLGCQQIIVIGLCSAADNAIRLAPHHPRISGMVLFDPICFEDPGFRSRALKKLLVDKLMHPVQTLVVLKRQATKFLKGKRRIDPLSLRDLPDRDQIKEAFKCLREREGHALSIFTSYATIYYNRRGQLAQVLDFDGEGRTLTEIFWPDVEHTYMLDVHRQRLIGEVVAWVMQHFAVQRDIHESEAIAADSATIRR
jgi:pimeloyl-ACP methyl ester carboxylesterase